ncbi:MAG: hypothetical protein JNG90_01920, partial [Planctomycetaceae bacterium]|nr:hypothetical protein [Planctomycetaceae bacterium]
MIAAVGIAVGGTILHRLQPDGLAFLTVFPVWCWWLPGLILAAVGGRQASRRVRVVVAITWVFAIGLSSDTPLALLRPTHPLPRQTQAHAAQKLLRVVSFNTGSERYRTADEIGRWAPDIVLLQESYPRDDVAKLAHALFG